MHILPLPVIQKHAAVLIAISQLHALLCKKIQNNAMAQFSQVSGEDEIVFVRRVPVSWKKAERVS